MARKIANLLLTIVLSLGVVLLGAGTAVRVYQILIYDKGDEQRENIPVKRAGSKENHAGNRVLLAELCGELEEMLSEDTTLHINNILQAPGEYAVWGRLPEIARIGEEGLTNDEWLMYQKLYWYKECYEEACQLPDYSCMLSDLTGILNKLPEVFYTWHFESGDDLEAYEEALKQVPDLLSRFMDGLVRQNRTGMLYPQNILKRQIEVCKRQFAQDSIFLDDYAARIRSCEFLTKEDKEALIKNNQVLVKENVWDSYQKVIAFMENLPSTDECYGLSYYPEGEKYYAYLLKITTGSERTVPEMNTYLEEKRKLIKESLSEMEQAEGALDSDSFSLSAEGIMDMLCNYAESAYPVSPQKDYEIASIPEKIDSALYQAFYMKDERNDRNYIYIGKSAREGKWLSLYQTLAHEAVPGHMYCYNFPRQSEYPNLERQIKCMGYSEGWALYAELSAAEGLSKQSLKEAYIKQFYQKLYDEIVLCQIDIGIHTMNWTVEDIERFCVEVYGAGSREVAENVMTTLSQNPGAYQVYVMGYFEIEELREKYCDGKGVPESDFIRALLSCGQASFRIVDAYMERVFGAQAYIVNEISDVVNYKVP